MCLLNVLVEEYQAAGVDFQIRVGHLKLLVGE